MLANIEGRSEIVAAKANYRPHPDTIQIGHDEASSTRGCVSSLHLPFTAASAHPNDY